VQRLTRANDRVIVKSRSLGWSMVVDYAANVVPPATFNGLVPILLLMFARE